MEVTFTIFARKTSGEVFECFRWCRDAQSGVDRAFTDANAFNVDIAEAWAQDSFGTAFIKKVENCK